MRIKDRSGYTVEVDFEYMHTLCKRYVCDFGDWSFVTLADPLDGHLVDFYLLVFDSVDEKERFVEEFGGYQVDRDLDSLVGSWDMTLEG